MGEGFKRYKPPAVRDVTPRDVVQPGKKIRVFLLRNGCVAITVYI